MEAEGHWAVPLWAHPPHACLWRRVSGWTLRTVLASASSPPAQASPRLSLSPCFARPRILPFFLPFPSPSLSSLTRLLPRCLSPHPLVRSGGDGAAEAAAAPLLFRGSLELGLWKIAGAAFGLGSALSACARTGRSDPGEKGVWRCGVQCFVARGSPGCAARLALWPLQHCSWQTGGGTWDASNKVRQGPEVTRTTSAASRRPGPGEANRSAVRSWDLHQGQADSFALYTPPPLFSRVLLLSPHLCTFSLLPPGLTLPDAWVVLGPQKPVFLCFFVIPPIYFSPRLHCCC